MTERWMADAACVGHDPQLWFAENIQGRNGGDSEETLKARAICQECPVRLACVDFAMRTDSSHWARFGIYGGLDGDERRALARAAS